MACTANVVDMNQDVCPLSDSDYRRLLFKVHPDRNLGCVADATSKSAAFNAKRANCTQSPAKKSPAKKSPAKKSPTKKSPAKKSPAKKSPTKNSPRKSKRSHYNAFRTRNNLNYEDVYKKFKTGTLDAGVDVAKDLWQATKGAANTVYGLGKASVDAALGVFNVTYGISSLAYHAAKTGVRTLTHGQTSFNQMRYRQAQKRLQTCTKCSKEELDYLKSDIESRFAQLKHGQDSRRLYLLKEAEKYAKELSPDIAKEFLLYATEEIEQDHKKAMQSLS